MNTATPRYSVHQASGSWHVLFRVDGKQVKRRIGACGRGGLSKAQAWAQADEIVAEHVAAAPAATVGSFRRLAREYLEHRQQIKGIKPSTSADYRSTLAEPGTAPKKRGRPHNGHVMAALGDLPAATITPADIEKLLATVEATGASPRT